eukprot:TRINITY_DN23646_c0_g1_i1.p2 TRINITY_DN23646_c0_g1~~TRINITY_DN23646_c0_g1_i1.p2  ORF type:complete len:112 (+),score=22.94 TRINITY_DN23646_c0_g1_i1:33-368(+)
MASFLTAGTRFGDLKSPKKSFGDDVLSSAEVVSVDAKSLTLRMVVGPEHVNQLGTMHGACMVLMLDVFTTLSLLVSVPRPSVSVNMSSQFAGAAKLGEELTIECKVDKVGN